MTLEQERQRVARQCERAVPQRQSINLRSTTIGNVRTSLNYPLIIDEVAVPGVSGRIGMTMLPGRSSAESTQGHVWRRDLETDLAVIRRAAPGLLLTLNEAPEFARFGVPEFERTLAASDLPWRHLPIPDAGIPGATFENDWRGVGAEARACLRAGKLVIIHCRAGLGRTGTIAARLLIEFGESPLQAMRTVRAARPYTIETRAQERYLATISPVAA